MIGRKIIQQVCFCFWREQRTLKLVHLHHAYHKPSFWMWCGCASLGLPALVPGRLTSPCYVTPFVRLLLIYPSPLCASPVQVSLYQLKGESRNTALLCCAACARFLCMFTSRNLAEAVSRYWSCCTWRVMISLKPCPPFGVSTTAEVYSSRLYYCSTCRWLL